MVVNARAGYQIAPPVAVFVLVSNVFDARYSIHGSTNLNCRSLENDKDFELVVLIDDPSFARCVLEEVRDADIRCSRQVIPEDIQGISFDALRKRMRDPRTLLLISRRLL